MPIHRKVVIIHPSFSFPPEHSSALEDRLLTDKGSPLHLACTMGHLEVAKMLVAASAPINAGNAYGNCPINSALIGGHRGVSGLLVVAKNILNENTNTVDVQRSETILRYGLYHAAYL